MWKRTYGVTFIIGVYVASSMMAADNLDRIVAKVDNAIITLSDIEEASFISIQEIKEKYPSQEWSKKIKQAKSQILSALIDEYVCLRVARENEIVVSEEEIEAQIQQLRNNAGIINEEQFTQELRKEGLTLEEFRESVRRQSTLRKILQREVYSKIAVKEGDIKTYYEENQNLFQQPAKAHIALLLLEVDGKDEALWERNWQKAMDIHQRLLEGGEFAELVKEFSQGPAKLQGGDIGYIEKGKTLPSIEEVAFVLSTGDFSEPFKTPYGWNIIKILDLKEENILALSEVRDDIEHLLRKINARDTEIEWFEKQRSRTFIEQYPL